MARVIVLGGYGNAGSQIVDLLLRACDAEVVVAGRHADRGRAFVAAHASLPGTERLSAVTVDACDEQSLADALSGAALCIVAAGRAPTAAGAARACITSGTDYLDIQLGSEKVRDLRTLDRRAREAGVCLVTDGGFHPGVPAAMVRRVAARMPELARADVGSVIAMDWDDLKPLARSTVDEMLDEFRDFSYEEYVDGRWRTARRSRKMRFPEPFGVRPCAAMGLAEMREVTAQLPQLRDTGFFVGGFNPVADRIVIPVVWLAMRLAPNRTRGPMGTLLLRSLERYSKPPYGTILQLDGGPEGAAPRTLMRISHPDGYTMTAAPAVATALQLLDGTARPPGVHLQALVVEPERFFADLAELGITVELLV